jgi:hypothetical protein
LLLAVEICSLGVERCRVGVEICAPVLEIFRHLQTYEVRFVHLEKRGADGVAGDLGSLSAGRIATVKTVLQE